MRLLCIEFPTLPVALARKSHPHLAERPLVLLAGTGADAAVTAVSPAVASRGVTIGMRAAEARALCNSAMFLPDNVSACVDELERICSIIARYATVSVAIASSTTVMIDISTANDERRTAESLLSLARQWTRLDVRGGIGSNRHLAASAASNQRRGLAIDNRPAAEDERPLVATSPVKGRVTLHGDADANRRRIAGMVTRLDTVQTSLDQACREVRLRVVADDMTVTRTLRFDRPVRAADTRDRIEAAVSALPAVGASFTLEVELARPVPLALALPLVRELAAAV